MAVPFKSEGEDGHVMGRNRLGTDRRREIWQRGSRWIDGLWGSENRGVRRQRKRRDGDGMVPTVGTEEGASEAASASSDAATEGGNDQRQTMDLPEMMVVGSWQLWRCCGRRQGRGRLEAASHWSLVEWNAGRWLQWWPGMARVWITDGGEGSSRRWQRGVGSGADGGVGHGRWSEMMEDDGQFYGRWESQMGFRWRRFSGVLS